MNFSSCAFSQTPSYELDDLDVADLELDDLGAGCRLTEGAALELQRSVETERGARRSRRYHEPTT